VDVADAVTETGFESLPRVGSKPQSFAANINGTYLVLYRYWNDI